MAKSKGSTKRRRRKSMNPFLKMALFVVFCIAVFVFLSSAFFNVKQFEIKGNSYYTESQIKSISGLSTGKNLIFETKIKAARDNLLDSPYIKNVKLTKKLPNTVVIEVEERKEFAAILSGERYIFIDSEGLVLRSASTETEPLIPIITGLSVKACPDGSPLEAEQSYLLSKSIALLKGAADIDFYFQRLELSAVSVKAYMDYDIYYCDGDIDVITKYLSKVKTVVANQRSENITRGRILVYSSGNIVLDP